MAGGAGDFATVTWNEFDVVDRRSERHGAEWHRVAQFRSDVGTGDDGRSNFQTEWGKDVGFLAVFILDQSDAAGAVRIVFDADDRGRRIVLTALEINQAVVTLVATADVAAGDAAGVVTATAALERGEEALLRLALGHLVEGREILVAGGRRDWLEIFQGHDNRNVRVFRLGSGKSLRSGRATRLP